MSNSIDQITRMIRFSEISSDSLSNFTHEMNMKEHEVDLWIKECLAEIQSNLLMEDFPPNASSWRASEKALVTCTAHRKEDSDLYELSVVVARDYFSTVIDDFNPKMTYDFVQVKSPRS